MKSTVHGLLIGAMFGGLIGWGIASAVRSPEKPGLPPDREERLRAEILSLKARIEAMNRPAEPAPRAAEPPRPGPTTSAAVPAGEPRTPVERPASRDARRVSDCLRVVTTAPNDRYREALADARKLLHDRDGQLGFLSDLYTLTPAQLVVLWDVFWLTDRERSGGFGAYGIPFASDLSQALLQLFKSSTEIGTRALAANMLLPDTRHLSDRQLEEFRVLMAADTDPGIRDKAARLPLRQNR